MNDRDILIIADQVYAELEYVRAFLAVANWQADAARNDPDAFTPNSLYNSVIKANEYYAPVRVQVEELIDMTRRMIAQRESAKEAYGQGWEAAIKDLYDKLDSDEYADLLAAIGEIRQGKR